MAIEWVWPGWRCAPEMAQVSKDLRGLVPRQSRLRGIATHVRFSGSFSPYRVFSSHRLGCPHAKKCLKRAGTCGEERRDVVFLIQAKPPVLLSATLHVPVKSPPTRSASPPYRRVFVKRLCRPTPDFVHHIHIGVRFYLTMTRTTHVALEPDMWNSRRLVANPRAWTINSASTRGLPPGPSDLHTY